MLQDYLDREREKSRQQGEAEGLAKAEAENFAIGFAEGLAEAKAECALNLLNMGFDINMIAQSTGLSETEIMRLQDDSTPQKFLKTI